MDTEYPKLIKESQVAEIFGVKMPTLRRWRWSGDGPPFIKIGRAVQYDPAEITAFIDAARRQSTSNQRETQ